MGSPARVEIRVEISESGDKGCRGCAILSGSFWLLLVSSSFFEFLRVSSSFWMAASAWSADGWKRNNDGRVCSAYRAVESVELVESV